jgi:tetratricopeptide (TPR) repeat protein
MSSRIGGAFPEDRTGRPERSDRPRSTGRPGDRRTSFGAGNRTDRPARAGGPSSYGSRPRPSGDFDRDRERPERRRDDRRGSASELPRIPDSITEDQLSREVKSELGGLPADMAIVVGRYMVAAELESDPEQSYRYAQAARHYAARIGVVRDVSGITAYKTGRWTEALAELRAARRLTGRNDYLALMADAERGLGRLDRALEVVHSPEAKRLPRAAQIELRIVESGIRRDQGLADAAVLALQVPELTDGKLRPWSARLFYAYGDALLAAGRREAAREAFSRAVVADEDEQTDALARLDELDGITVADLEDDDEDDEELDTSDASDADLDDEDDDGDDDEESDLDDEADADLDDEEDDDADDEDDDDEDDDLDDEEAPYEADLDAVVEEEHDDEGDDDEDEPGAAEGEDEPSMVPETIPGTDPDTDPEK